MKALLHVSRVYVSAFLVSLLVFLSCKKDAVPIDPKQSNAALSKAGVANLALPILGDHQTSTATRFNDYPDRLWPDNFDRFNASNLAVDDDSYIYSGKISPKNKQTMVFLQGFGFTIPLGARIDNIFLRVIRFKKGNALLRDHFARLNKYLNDDIGAINYYGFYWQNHEYYSTSETEVIYSQPGTGTVTPTSTTTYQWTPAMINDPDFGVIIHTIVEKTGSAIVYYDLVEITVEFTIL